MIISAVSVTSSSLPFMIFIIAPVISIITSIISVVVSSSEASLTSIMLFVETLFMMTLMMMGTEAAPVILTVVIVSGSISIGLLIIIIPLRSDWICSLKLFLLIIVSFGSLIRVRGLSLFS